MGQIMLFNSLNDGSQTKVLSQASGYRKQGWEGTGKSYHSSVVFEERGLKTTAKPVDKQLNIDGKQGGLLSGWEGMWEWESKEEINQSCTMNEKVLDLGLIRFWVSKQVGEEEITKQKGRIDLPRRCDFRTTRYVIRWLNFYLVCETDIHLII